MWADYQNERLGKQVIENDKGFAIYDYIDAEQCYLEDIYVKPEFRKTGVASELADIVTELAKAKGCKYLIGSVVCGLNGDTNAMKAFLAYGMRLSEVNGRVIILSKDIGE